MLLLFREGESVVIPPGQNILLDISPPQLYLIIIEGTLAFEDIEDINLNASYIFIRKGHLIVGTEDRPHQHKVRSMERTTSHWIQFFGKISLPDFERWSNFEL